MDEKDKQRVNILKVNEMLKLRVFRSRITFFEHEKVH